MAVTICQTHNMSIRLCGCGAPAPVSDAVREVERDFTRERAGKRGLHTPFRGCVIVECPECGKLGAYCATGRRGGRRATWVHEAVVSYVGEDCRGYTSHDSCSLTGERLAAWRRRRARKEAKLTAAR